MPMSPDLLQLAMDQCGLRLNEQGGLVLTNTKSPCGSPPATMGFGVPRALPTGLNLEVAEEIHQTLVAQLQEEMRGTGSLAPLVAITFSLPLPGNRHWAVSPVPL